MAIESSDFNLWHQRMDYLNGRQLNEASRKN